MLTTTSFTPALSFQPSSMSTAQLAAVSFLARYSGATQDMCTAPRAWTGWS